MPVNLAGRSWHADVVPDSVADGHEDGSGQVVDEVE
jgi:hypothetical protein